MPIGAVGAAVLGAGVIGAGASLIGSSQAAGAARDAAGVQQNANILNINRTNPYVGIGYSAGAQLQDLNTKGFGAGDPNYLALSQDAMPGRMSQAELENTPGYQFNLQNGLRATQNSAAARGLGVSGAALKGAAAYATGLADSTYQNQFNNAQTRSQDYINLNTANQGNQTNLFNRLADTTKIGANVAVGQGSNSTTSAGNQGNFLSSAGQLQGAGTVGVGSAATGAANNFVSNSLLQQFIAKQNGGGTSFITPLDTSQNPGIGAAGGFT